MQLFNYSSDDELLIGLRTGSTAINFSKGMELYGVEESGILSFISIEEMLYEDLLTADSVNRIYSWLVENDKLTELGIIGDIDYHLVLLRYSLQGFAAIEL